VRKMERLGARGTRTGTADELYLFIVLGQLEERGREVFGDWMDANIIRTRHSCSKSQAGDRYTPYPILRGLSAILLLEEMK
jgi:hypothetical protein